MKGRPLKSYSSASLMNRARLAGLNYSTVRKRIALGWTIEESLGEPAAKRRKRDAR